MNDIQHIKVLREEGATFAEAFYAVMGYRPESYVPKCLHCDSEMTKDTKRSDRILRYWDCECGWHCTTKGPDYSDWCRNAL